MTDRLPISWHTNVWERRECAAESDLKEVKKACLGGRFVWDGRLDRRSQGTLRRELSGPQKSLMIRRTNSGCALYRVITPNCVI